MSNLSFEWDPKKAAANVRKHGVSFEEARTAFEDDEALLLPDPDHSTGEERAVLLGLSAALRALVVVHCERHDGDVIRLISARKADPYERRLYAARRS
jgi:uncharacterized DUF497 family protein